MAEEVILTEEEYQLLKLETKLIEITEQVFLAEDLDRLKNEIKKEHWNLWKRYKVKYRLDNE